LEAPPRVEAVEAPAPPRPPRSEVRRPAGVAVGVCRDPMLPDADADADAAGR
jgi:hypothetical protein